MRAASSAVNDNTKAMAGLSFQSKQTLVQLPDIVQGIASGQGVFRTAIQQGGQLVQIYGMGPGGVGGSLRQVGSELAAMLTPMRLVGGGIAAIVIATTAAVLSWKNYATALDDLSHITGTATAELSRLQTAASIKGIGQDDFAGGMRRFADAVYDAKAGTNDLATLLRLNGKTVSDTAGTLDTVAELVRRAKDDQQRLQILQQAGLPATMEWVRLTRGGAEGLRAAKEEATKFGGALNDEMVAKAREFDEAWNRAWTNFGISMRRAVVEGYDLLQRLIEQGREAVGAFDRATGGRGLSTVGSNLLKSGYGTPLSQDMGQLYGGLLAGQKGAGDTSGVRDATWLAQQQRAIQLEQQRISLLGEAATAADHRREVELRLQAAQLAGVSLTEQQIEKIKRYAQEERSLAETQERLSVLGSAATEVERYAARIQELGVALHHNKISQDDFNRAVAAAHPLFEPLKSAASEFATGFASDLREGVNAMDALTNAATRLSDRLIDMALNQAINSLFAKAFQFVGGLGAPLNILPNANGNVFSGGNIILFVRGGIVSSLIIFLMVCGYGLMGEAGPEAVMPLRRSQDGKLGVVAAGRGGVVVNMNIINNAGSDVQVRQQSQARQNSDGSISLDVVIERAVRNAVNSDVANNGPMTQGLARRFNLNSAAGIA
jgi:phage-related minor tail protein